MLRSYQLTCKICGIRFTYMPHTRLPKVPTCGEACLKSYRRQQAKEAYAAKTVSDRLITLMCRECGSEFEHIKRQGRTPSMCSDECKRMRFNRVASETYVKKRENGAPVKIGKTRPCTKCSKPVSASRSDSRLDPVCHGCRRIRNTKNCVRCGNKFYRPHNAAKYCSKKCINPPLDVERKKRRERDKCRKRRCIKAGAMHEPYTTDQIAARDNYTCGICGYGVNMDVEWPDGQFASIDHIVALVNGGDDVPSNVQLSHLSCNLLKGTE